MKKGNVYRLVGVLLMSLILMLACIGADATLGEVGFSRALDSNGQPAEKISSFAPGETVLFNLEFTGGYEGLEATITWKRGEQTLQTNTVKLDREASSLDPLWISAQLETKADWPMGEYQCEYFVPDQGTQTIDFTLE
jgi:hypothetical protein